MYFNTKNTLLFLSFVVFLTSCFRGGMIGIYSDTSVAYAKDFTKYLEPDAKLIQSWYHYTVEVDSNKKHILKTYYPEKKTMTARKEFSDSGMTILEGKSSYYTDEGQLVSEGFYSDNMKTGEWKEYSRETGVLQQKGNYVMGKKEGLWEEYDSLGNITTSYMEEELAAPIQSVEFYRVRDFLADYSSNTRTTVGTTDLMINSSSESLDKLPEFPGCGSIMDEEKRENCSATKMLQFINSNLHYPRIPKKLNVEGTALMKFAIDKNGSVKDITAIQGICAPIEEECKRIIKMMPKWKPGERNGEAVRVYFNLPIKFNVEYY